MPSSWAAGFGLGICLAAALGLAALDRGQPVPWQQCIAVTVLGLGLVPSLEFGVRSIWAVLTAIGGAYLEWRERTAPELPDDEPEMPDPTDYPTDWQMADQAAIDMSWRVSAHRFIQAGAVHGFLVRTLAGAESPHNVIAWEDWGPMVKVLIAAGVLIKNGGTRWADGWSYVRWLEERDELALPHPNKLAPDVKMRPVNTATTTTSQQTKQDREPPPRVVVEHVP